MPRDSKSATRSVVIALALALPTGALAQETPTVTPHASSALPAPKAADVLDEATDFLAAALFQTDKPADPPAALAAATVAIQNAIAALGERYDATARLSAALQDVLAAPTPADALALVRDRVRPVHADLAFRPTIEAPIPPGWPAFTPINEIEIKSYPTYRVAFTTKKPMLFKESRNFWTLFNHISSRNIPMTAPVEMPLIVASQGEISEDGMGFLYPDMNTGKLGQADDGAVTVVDVAPITVVNIGVRGKSSDARIAKAHEKLVVWLAANKDRYVAAGNPRVMGWNGPSTSDRDAYTEVQIPIKPR